MKKIKQATWDDLHASAVALDGKREELRSAYAEWIVPLLEELDGIRAEAHETLTNLAEEAETYFDGRSEKWQEGEKGSAYADWKGSLETARDGFEDAIEIDFDEALAPVEAMLTILNEDMQQSPEE